jgi:hypothetical protein
MPLNHTVIFFTSSRRSREKNPRDYQSENTSRALDLLALALALALALVITIIMFPAVLLQLVNPKGEELPSHRTMDKQRRICWPRDLIPLLGSRSNKTMRQKTILFHKASLGVHYP